MKTITLPNGTTAYEVYKNGVRIAATCDYGLAVALCNGVKG